MKRTFTYVAFLILILLVGVPAYAQTTDKTLRYVPLETLPNVTPQVNGEVNFSSLINGAFQTLLALAVAFAIVKMVWGGFMYMTSEIVDKKAQAKAHIASSLKGLFLLLCSVLILKTINPDLVNLDLERKLGRMLGSDVKTVVGSQDSTNQSNGGSTNNQNGSLNSITDLSSCAARQGCPVPTGEQCAGNCVSPRFDASICNGNSVGVSGGTCYLPPMNP